MEKYARQAISEGSKSADDLLVTDDCEIYRVLNLHYNRNNHINVSILCDFYSLLQIQLDKIRNEIKFN